MIKVFMGRRPLSVRDHALSKSLASPCVTDLDRWKIRGKNQFFRSGSVTHGLAKLSIFYFTNLGLSFIETTWSLTRGRRPMKSKKSLNLP